MSCVKMYLSHEETLYRGTWHAYASTDIILDRNFNEQVVSFLGLVKLLPLPSDLKACCELHYSIV